MKRLAALLISILFYAAAAHADPTLVGRWKSNGQMSMQFNEDRARLEDRSIKFLTQLMGRMTVTFDQRTVTYEMKDWEVVSENGERRPFVGFKEVQPYRLIGHTPKSVAIRSREPVTGEERITVFNFVDSNTMWVYSGRTAESVPTEHLREYFVRQP